MKLYPICINTFRETVRDRLLYNLLLFALLMIGSTVYLATLTIAEPLKIIKDFGLGAISLFGALIAIFVGISLIYKEVEKRTIYTIIAKPIRRYEFLLGKYLGLLFTLLVNLAIMSAAFMLVLFLIGGIFAPELLVAIYFIYLELMVLTGLTILFSSFTTPTLSAIFTLALFAIGHLSGDLKLLSQKSPNPLVKAIAGGMYYLLPNLENFNVKGEVVYNMPISSDRVMAVTSYALLYLAAVLLASIVIFQRKDFK